ncbi:hypothetical protein SEMRO_1182_G250030.1 [Seminavis robusta]|uniref:Uncharacterized protein n=1 Tax=Seminavis robusta TaxID=568900 RepID=A0A9N8EJK1_9STRA|nr:hypothetical protein SEMRO_1182_G250030.1 [Seminavis robusta]|eukprot:Sro1182_g250030.1 n/a (104) ;mRNA; f:34486-34797
MGMPSTAGGSLHSKTEMTMIRMYFIGVPEDNLIQVYPGISRRLPGFTSGSKEPDNKVSVTAFQQLLLPSNKTSFKISCLPKQALCALVTDTTVALNVASGFGE